MIIIYRQKNSINSENISICPLKSKRFGVSKQLQYQWLKEPLEWSQKGNENYLRMTYWKCKRLSSQVRHMHLEDHFAMNFLSIFVFFFLCSLFFLCFLPIFLYNMILEMNNLMCLFWPRCQDDTSMRNGNWIEIW